MQTQKQRVRKPSVTVRIRKDGNMLGVSPVDSEMLAALTPKFSFQERVMRYLGGECDVQLIPRRLCQLKKLEGENGEDLGREFCVYFGFWDVVYKTLIDMGYKVEYVDSRPAKEMSGIYTPVWENISHIDLRSGQREFLEAMVANQFGRFDCGTGFGKSFLISLIAMIWPRARISVVTKNIAVAKDRIYSELSQRIPDVGIVCSQLKVPNKRVMVYTLGSVAHADTQADVLIADEVHQLSTEKSIEQLSRWGTSRNYGLSASHDMRWDNNDIRAHGLFGPIVYKMSFAEAVAANNVVPIRVVWTLVSSNRNPIAECRGLARKRLGIWFNRMRNELIAADARSYSDDEQVLICTDTIDHSVRLKALLPEYTMIYSPASMTEFRMKDLIREGYVPPGEQALTLKSLRKFREDFEMGALKKVIATTVWNVGVSFNKLSALVRAAGGSSDINSVQIPGRVARLAEGKTHGEVRDYIDAFDYGCLTESRRRAKRYRELGFSQTFPSDAWRKTILGDV